MQCPKIIAKPYKDMVTPMEHRVNEVWLLCNQMWKFQLAVTLLPMLPVINS